jgi:hypothetical protein
MVLDDLTPREEHMKQYGLVLGLGMVLTGSAFGQVIGGVMSVTQSHMS